MQDLESRGLEYMKERFGVSEEDLKPLTVEERNGDLWLVNVKSSSSLEPETNGIRFIRNMDIGLKPTTYGLQRIGPSLGENIVEVNRKELMKLLERQEMIKREMEEKGYVSLCFRDRIIGCGFYKNGKVSSRIPKGRGKELLDIISGR